MIAVRARAVCVLALLLLSGRASAHIIPVPPSDCTFDPVTIEAPASGVVGTAAPPGSADQFRILYDPQASNAEFDLRSVPPRTFTAAGVQGTFALPAIVFAAVRNSRHNGAASLYALQAMDAGMIGLSLTGGGGKLRQHLTALRKALDLLKQTSRDYSMMDIIRLLEKDEDPQNAALVDDLEYLAEVDIFAREGTRIDELVVKGQTTIVDLKGTPPDIQELIVNRLCTALFELRKVNKIPPLMLAVEEAHNFCPQVGQVASSKVFRTIASEGRKFGLGILIVTQRAAKVDKNVLSQCNTQIILKVTNPNDLKAISSSVEGLTPGMEDEIQRLPIGVAIVTGAGLQMPMMVEVRPRETRHGGESVQVIPD